MADINIRFSVDENETQDYNRTEQLKREVKIEGASPSQLNDVLSELSEYFDELTVSIRGKNSSK